MLIYDISKCISKPYDVVQPENLFSVDPHNYIEDNQFRDIIQ